MQLGTIGVWFGAFTVAPAVEAPAGRPGDRGLGYDTLWYSRARHGESFSQAAVLLAATDRFQVASGIADIWARDAVSAANAARVLSGRLRRPIPPRPRRQPPTTGRPRGHVRSPVATMRAFLDAMDDDPFVGPDARPPRPPAARPRSARLSILGSRKSIARRTSSSPRRRPEILGPPRMPSPSSWSRWFAGEFAKAPRRPRALLHYLGTPYLGDLHWLGLGGRRLRTGGSLPLVEPSSQPAAPTRSSAAHLEARGDRLRSTPRRRSVRPRGGISSRAVVIERP